MLEAVDFFCSAGGVTCGFNQAGIKVLGGIDIDVNCKETYERNNNAKFLCKDVSTLKKKTVGSFFKIKRNQDNLIFVGCSPCQYYSNIKTDKAKSEETRLLLADFQEFVEYYMPGYVFIENVPGLDTDPGSPLAEFKSSLTHNGYVYDEGIVNAKYFGVPQNRRRYVLIASRLKDSIQLPKGNKKTILTVKEAIGNLDRFPKISDGTIDKTSFAHTSARLTPINLKRIRSTPHNGGDRRAWNNSPELQLNCYKEHTGHYDVYGRMHWDKPSPTITTRFDSFSNGRYGHPEQDRAISLREGATLQSFPLDYQFYSKSQGVIAKMIGNAVPPKLAKEIAESFKM
ncbi:MAG: DNA cytosine methyltransferase [Bacteroidales bacterium]|nr:DNA cytosine methyltransferase [Bacteroidales bacterium]